MTNRPVRILCVDDHGFVGEGLKARLAIEPDLEFVDHLETATDLVAHVQRSDADIVLLDIEMPGPDAFEAMTELRRRCPQVRTILLSAYVRDRYIDAAYKAGAWGYLSKNDTPDEVIEGIRKVTEGELAFSAEVLARSQTLTKKRGARAAARSKLGLLTVREEQILRLIAKGMSRTQIADELCRSPMTIDNHRKSIMKKLGMRDRVELVRYAIAEGLGDAQSARPT